MKIAVCDDDKAAREHIVSLIKEQIQDAEIMTFATGEEMLKVQSSFDISFLDVEMREVSGMDVANHIRQKEQGSTRSIIIFVTGYEKYMNSAFDVSAFHYLLKPIEEEKFREVFHRAERELEKRKSKRRETVFIKTRNRSFSLEKDSILYIESRGKKVEIHTTGETIEAYASMNEMEGQLGGGFFRCHRGYLVNMAYVAEYDSGSITLNNGECVYLAKEKYGEFVKAYMRYLRNGVGADG